MRRKNEPVDVFTHIDMPPDGDPSPCWTWTGALNKSDGRPYFTVAGVRWLAYRLVYTLTFGAIPDGFVVRHKDCDNEACCNPYHLLAGSQGDNERDKYEEGHERWGFPVAVIEAVHTYNKAGMSQEQIARVCSAQFGVIVAQQRVSDILTGARRKEQSDAIKRRE